ncbi:MAG: Ig-like domain repeat protein, partial [Euryarchaeota archaeon]|nr:Ig-like domain repeat protein [Euryarchaeota archaeon]
FYNNTTLIGTGTTNSTGWSNATWNTTGFTGDFRLNVTYAANQSVFALATYNDTILVAVNATTNVSRVLLNNTEPLRGDRVLVSARLLYDNSTAIPDQSLQFYNNTTLIGTASTNSTGWANVTWNTALAPLGYYRINVTYADNRSVFAAASYNDTVLVAVNATTSVSRVEVNTTSPLQGQGVNITARLLYDNGTAIPGQTLEFRNNTTLLGSATTNSTGWASFVWDTSSVPRGTYAINASFTGNGSLFVRNTSNNTTTVTVVNEDPRWLTPAINRTEPLPVLSEVVHSVNWTDDAGLRSYIFSWNATGASCTGGFQNDTPATFSGPQAWSNVTRTTPAACAGRTIGWRVYANDTGGHTNETPLQAYNVSSQPTITGSAPAGNANDSAGETRVFNLTADQTVAVTWYINGTAIQTNTSATAASYTNTSAQNGTWNLTAYVNNTNGSAQQAWTWRVYPRAVLALGNVTNITQDWGRPFTLNHSINVTDNDTVDTLLLNYTVDWLANNTTQPPVAAGTRLYRNQTVNRTTMGNTTLTASANASRAVNSSQVFSINITRREIVATLLSEANQTAYPYQNFTINASAVDEYGEPFLGTAELIENETAVLRTLPNVERYANFSLNQTLQTTTNYTVRFTNDTHYYNNTTANTTATISKFWVTNLERHMVRVQGAVFIDLSLSGGIDFGIVSSGTVNQSAQTDLGYPLRINITENTNVKTNITVNGTDLQLGSTRVNVTNIAYSNTSSGTNLSLQPNFPAPIFTDWISIPQPGTGNNISRTAYFYVTIPTGQAAGNYWGNVTVQATQA